MRYNLLTKIINIRIPMIFRIKSIGNMSRTSMCRSSWRMRRICWIGTNYTSTLMKIGIDSWYSIPRPLKRSISSALICTAPSRLRSLAIYSRVARSPLVGEYPKLELSLKYSFWDNLLDPIRDFTSLGNRVPIFSQMIGMPVFSILFATSTISRIS